MIKVIPTIRSHNRMNTKMNIRRILHVHAREFHHTLTVSTIIGIITRQPDEHLRTRHADEILIPRILAHRLRNRSSGVAEVPEAVAGEDGAFVDPAEVAVECVVAHLERSESLQ